MSKFYKTEGIILKVHPLGEADKIVCVFSPQYGKFKAVAKGARKIKSTFTGKLEPLNCLSFFIVKGRSLDIITQVQLMSAWRGRDSLLKLTYGFYLLEVIDKVTYSHNPSLKLYNFVKDSARILENNIDLDWFCRFVEIKVLSELGYSPQLEHCQSCGNKSDNYKFSPAFGGLLCAACQNKDARSKKVCIESLESFKLMEKSSWNLARRLKLKETSKANLNKISNLMFEYNLGVRFNRPEK